jgi:hypothetical protein
MKIQITNRHPGPIVVQGLKLTIPPTEDPSAPSVVVVEGKTVHPELLELQKLGFIDVGEYTPRVILPAKSKEPAKPVKTEAPKANVTNTAEKDESTVTVALGHSKSVKLKASKQKPKLDPKYFPPGHPVHKAMEDAQQNEAQVKPATETKWVDPESTAAPAETAPKEFSEAFIDISSGKPLVPRPSK